MPEFFMTNVRKVEPVGGDCIRVYCALERNGLWEDQFTCVIPHASAIASAKFVADSAAEIHNELTMGEPGDRAH